MNVISVWLTFYSTLATSLRVARDNYFYDSFIKKNLQFKLI